MECGQRHADRGMCTACGRRDIGVWTAACGRRRADRGMRHADLACGFNADSNDRAVLIRMGRRRSVCARRAGFGESGMCGLDFMWIRMRAWPGRAHSRLRASGRRHGRRQPVYGMYYWHGAVWRQGRSPSARSPTTSVVTLTCRIPGSIPEACVLVH
jgi:hypothetical protein